MGPTIPQTLAIILPIAATALSSWLTDDHFKPWVNALIALLAIALTAALCEWLAGNWSGNWAESVAGVLAYTALLMQGDFKILHTFLVRQQSPVSSALGGPPPANSNPVTPLATRATVPGVPPRANRDQE